MDENTDSALHYGHLGRPVYLPDAKAWTFTRSLARGDHPAVPCSYKIANIL
jgi:RNA polymerase I-specific transcription initiation factor RRN6